MMLKNQHIYHVYVKQINNAMEKRHFVIFALVCICELLYSQALQIPYSCGFEDPVENANWVLNYGMTPTDSCAERWIVGTGERSEGTHSLYITANGYSAEYGANKNIVVAYREFSVPQNMRYDVSFDWKNNGYKDESDLYVLLIRPTDQVPVSNSQSGLIPNNSVIRLYRAVPYNRQSSWQNASFQQNLTANTNYKLLFVWANMNSDTTLTNPISACIDNIQITSTNCAKPNSFEVVGGCDTTRLSWKGTSAEYEVEYKSPSATRWTKMGVQTEKSATITGLSEGAYDFRVRGICGSDTSAYVTKKSVVIFCPELHCINYVALDDPSVVEAYAGTFSNPKASQVLVDYGSEDKRSRHTVNWVQNEYDPRTGNRLKTIPDGEFASVRLGNWDNGKEAESLVYPFIVDPSSTILLLKYAVVLQDPNHGVEDNPRFRLEILDASGNVIDPTCGVAYFAADKNRPGWQSAADDVTWKDWTVVGLNLETYVGQTLQISLTTYDCALSAHYGYAYFTLGCASATIETNSCGENPFVAVNAPEGFDYTWTNPDYPDSVWTTREIEIPSTDTTTYYCEVCYKEESSCCFTLSTEVFPRFPISDFDYVYTKENCQNVIRFNNLSHIMTRSDGNDVHTDIPCESYYWDFGNGMTSSKEHPELILSPDADTITVTLYASIANGECVDEYTTQIVVDELSVTLDTIKADICEGDFYVFDSGNLYLMQSGVYYDTLISSVTGCDSIIRLELTVHPQYDTIVYDSICFSDLPYKWNDKEYNTSGNHEAWLKSTFGCDSVVNLNLHVYDEIVFDAVPTPVQGAPNTGSITIDSEVDYASYSVNGEMNGALDGLSGGEYSILLYDENGCVSEEKTVVVNQDVLEILLSEDSLLICGDDKEFFIECTIVKGFASSYTVSFNAKSLAAGFVDFVDEGAKQLPIRIPLPDKIRPGQYNLSLAFKDMLSDSLLVFDYDFVVNYRSSLVVQKWNDVLALLNEKYNDGYFFSHIQWYMDGTPIEGATGPYYYVPNGNLNFGSEYCALLTRTDDGESYFTCPIIAVDKQVDQMTVSPNFLPAGRSTYLQTDKPGFVQVFDSMGNMLYSKNVLPGKTALELGRNVGYYLIKLQSDDGATQAYKILVY